MKLYIEPVEQYESEGLRAAVEKILAGIDFPLAGQKVLLKVNLLRKALPEQAITTHPRVVEEVARFLIERGAHVTIGDSPGGPMNLSGMQGIYRATGMEEVARKTGARLSEDLSSVDVHLPGARMLRDFPILTAVHESDLIINIAKLKTHGMMTYTGAVKNLFGVIHGMSKAMHHLKLQEPMPFAHHLIDVAEFVSADYHVIDGITAMEGNGPGGGDPRHLGYLLGGKNPHNLDRLACEIARIPEKSVPTLLAARARHLFEEVLIEGSYTPAQTPFVLPDSLQVTFLPFWLPRRLKDWLLDRTRPLPRFELGRCIGCGKCAAICPAKVISMEKGKAIHTRDGCISCFCCAEVCPVKAIETQQPFLSRFFRPK